MTLKFTPMLPGSNQLLPTSQNVAAQSWPNSVHYTPNGYIVPMEFRVHFFPRICAFSKCTKMHLNGVLLIGTEFFKIIVSL